MSTDSFALLLGDIETLVVPHKHIAGDLLSLNIFPGGEFLPNGHLLKTSFKSLFAVAELNVNDNQLILLKYMPMTMQSIFPSGCQLYKTLFCSSEKK